MRTVAAVLIVSAVMIPGAPARACCDDFLDAGTSGYAVAPAASSSSPSIAHQAAALGLHAVTTVYVGTSVVTSGDTTTFGAVTQQQHAGTYARLVASTATGEASPFDAVSGNPRLTLSDGRPVAGDYYANYLVSGGAVVFDRYVFFADDSETARYSVSTTPPTQVAAPPGSPSSGSFGGAPPAISYAPPPLPAPSDVSPPAVAEPDPVRDAPDDPPAPRDVRAGIALGAQSDPLASIEVLRGRPASLWMRATVDGAPARVLGWRLFAGELTALGPISGGGDEPLLASWRELPSDGLPFRVSVDVTVEVPGAAPRTVRAEVDVAVRSPAIVE